MHQAPHLTGQSAHTALEAQKDLFTEDFSAVPQPAEITQIEISNGETHAAPLDTLTEEDIAKPEQLLHVQETAASAVLQLVEDQAATLIQAHIKGFLVRKSLQQAAADFNDLQEEDILAAHDGQHAQTLVPGW